MMKVLVNNLIWRYKEWKNRKKIIMSSTKKLANLRKEKLNETK